jgi:hypothetical protein
MNSSMEKANVRAFAERPKLPIVALIGPTNLPRIARASKIDQAVYESAAAAAGAAVARHGAILMVVPDRGVAMHGLQAYRAAKGRWLIGLTPDGGPADDVASRNCRDNAALCDEVIGGLTWHHQHATICELAWLMVCVGLSCGTIAEIAWTKWIKGRRILAMRRTMTELPPEILAETDVVLLEDAVALDAALGRALDEQKVQLMPRVDRHPDQEKVAALCRPMSSISPASR